jgi:hypothetical protein
VYNTTNLEAGNTTFEIFNSINTISEFWFGKLILIVIFFISFIAFKKYETKVAFIGSSALTTFITILFFGLGWVTFNTIFIPLALLLGSVIWYSLTQ